MKKRLLIILLAAVLVLSLMPMTASADYASGKCGPNLTWTLEEDTLYITGTGTMYNYTGDSPLPVEDPDSVNRIYIDWNVTSIGDYAFYYFRNVTEVTMTDDVKSIGDSAFYGCGNLKEDLYVGLSDNLVLIGDRAFGSSGLKQVLIPGTVQSIGTSAFANTPMTKAVLGEGISEVSDYMFYDCENLSDVTLPSTVERIGELAFCYASALQSLELPSGLKVVDNGALSSTNIQTLSIPANTTSLSFLDSDSLESITVAEGNPNYAAQDGVLFNKNKTELLQFPTCKTVVSYKVPSAVTKIGNNAFRYNSYLIAVTIPAGVTSIGNKAFNSCKKLKNIYFLGNEDQWAAVTKGTYNDSLDSATIQCLGPTITTQPQSVSTVVDKTAAFQVAATGENLTYQWQYKAPGGSWKNTTLSGNQTDTLKVKATCGRHNYQYRCVITDGNGVTLNSNAAKLTVLGIKTQPAAVSTTAGKTAVMKVVATGASLTYQWQYQKADGTWANTTVSGNKTDTLSIPATAARSGNVYRCAVTSGSNTVYSDGAKLTVFGIKTQPANVSGKVGNTVTMKVVATGTNLTYQWQYKTDAGTWKNTTLTGAKTATLKIPVTLARDGNVYRCVVKSGSSTATSKSAKLTVFAIKTQPKAVTAAKGSTATMKVVAIGENLTYQWQYQKADGTWANTTLTGAKTATLSIPATAARNGNVYRCIVKSGTSTITSNAAKLTVK